MSSLVEISGCNRSVRRRMFRRMNMALFTFIFLAVGWSINLEAGVREGMSRLQVVAEWGQPTGSFTAGGKEVLMYSHGRRVELRDGVVVAVAASAPARAPATGSRPGHSPRPTVGTAAGGRDSAIPQPFAPFPEAHRDMPELSVAWSEDPQTDELFLMGHRRGRDLPRLHGIAGRRGMQELQAALAQGADLQERDALGRTALHRYAVYNTGITPTLEMMQVLLDGGLEVDARDRFGQTALHIAAQHQGRTTRFLLEAGADPNAVDRRGRTPLHLAVLRGVSHIRDILLAAGANPALADGDGVTVAEIEREQRLWVSRHKLQGQQIASLAYGQNRFVAGGSFNPAILLSGDGTSWLSESAPHSAGLRSVVAVRNGFLGYGAARGIYWSDDGVAWEMVHGDRQPMPLDFAAASPERMVMMGQPATVMHSIDGRTWDSLRHGLAAYIVGLDWIDDYFLAVNREGVLLYSPDGLNWGGARLDLRGLTLKRLRRVNGYWYGLGYYGLMIRSRNGVDWEHVPIDTLQPINDIAWGNGLFVAVGGRGLILVSEDGFAWRQRRTTETADLLAVAFGGNAFVALNRETIWTRHHSP